MLKDLANVKEKIANLAVAIANNLKMRAASHFPNAFVAKVATLKCVENRADSSLVK